MPHSSNLPSLIPTSTSTSAPRRYINDMSRVDLCEQPHLARYKATNGALPLLKTDGGDPRLQSPTCIEKGKAISSARAPDSRNHANQPSASPVADTESAIPTSRPSSTPPRTIPSLLRFVDHDLMQRAPIHDHPRYSHSSCTICDCPWNTPAVLCESSDNPSDHARPVPITFLPLWPCGHWVHYRCLIWRATQQTDSKDKCPECNVQIFQWEGITTLTLATRTELDMNDGSTSSYTDEKMYEGECATIEALIHSHFFAELARPSKFVDSSPNLIQAYYNTLNALERMKKPAAKWLQYSTQAGYLLFGMFVAIKMRRYLMERHERIQDTEGWREFEEGKKTLQSRILDEVHKP